ncbi:MAG: hypothetical protein KDC54_21245, partial [Lewinella sp.]|nr:hypothetical protein [Lewinella sp.]
MTFPPEKRQISNYFIHNKIDQALLDQCETGWAIPILAYGIKPAYTKTITKTYRDKDDNEQELTIAVTGDDLVDGFHIISDTTDGTLPFWRALKKKEPSSPFPKDIVDTAPNRVALSFYPGDIDPSLEGRWKRPDKPAAFASFKE